MRTTLRILIALVLAVPFLGCCLAYALADAAKAFALSMRGDLWSGWRTVKGDW